MEVTDLTLLEGMDNLGTRGRYHSYLQQKMKEARLKLNRQIRFLKDCMEKRES